MPLASDDIVIDVSPAITLQPSLRAAYRLERKYDGFEKLFQSVAGGSVTAIADVIREGAGDCALTRYLDDAPLRIALDRLVQPCLQFIFELSGANEASDQGVTGKPIPFREHHTRLFRIATGWLGWTPDAAWNAAPAEIIEAQKGRMEMLNAIFGGKSDETKPSDISDSDTRRRLNAIGNLTNHSVPR